jgi:hypothetical protein
MVLHDTFLATLFHPQILSPLPMLLRKRDKKGRRGEGEVTFPSTREHVVVPMPQDRIPMAKWPESNMASTHITGWHVKGFLSYAKAFGCRIPDDRCLPRPGPNEVVLLTTFQERGLGLPVHHFFHGLLYYYKIKHHHLASCRILHIVMFITLCEAFLGI